MIRGYHAEQRWPNALTMPVLVIHHTATLPDGERVVEPGLDHVGHPQAPGQVAAILADAGHRHPLVDQ